MTYRPTQVAFTCLFTVMLLLGHTTQARCDDKQATESVTTSHALPKYVDVFVRAKDGYPRVRIPALVTTHQGTLLAFAEGRQAGDHSKNDIILKRSEDNGKTWKSMQLVHEAGNHALNNPQPVVLASGRVLLMYQKNRFGEYESKAGFGPDSCFTLTQHSDDDGKTWSPPKDVSRGVKRAKVVTSVAAGPGVGIVLERGQHKGRILMPFNQGPGGAWKVYSAYSDDNGDTWQYGETAPEDGFGFGNEVQMVELSDGRVMLNARAQDGRKYRKIAYSKDGGLTWSKLQDDSTLIGPICQAAILRYSWPEDGKSRILFLNPASQSHRKNGTLRLSVDEGKTWAQSAVIYPGGFAYSCITKMKNGQIGLLFERDAKKISFMALPMQWLEGSE